MNYIITRNDLLVFISTIKENYEHQKKLCQELPGYEFLELTDEEYDKEFYQMTDEEYMQQLIKEYKRIEDDPDVEYDFFDFINLEEEMFN